MNDLVMNRGAEGNGAITRINDRASGDCLDNSDHGQYGEK